jgi:hypothetical protein
MNAPIQILRTRPAASLAGLVLLVSTSAGVGGCADVRRAVSLPPVNPESPVAAKVETTARQTFPRPRLRDVPPLPKNVPPAGVIKTGVAKMVGCRTSILSYAPAHPPLSSGADAYAGELREIAQADRPENAPPSDAAAKSEDLASRLRQFAAPPAPIASGAPLTADMGKPPPEGAPPGLAPPVPAAPPPPGATAPGAAPAGLQAAAPARGGAQVIEGPPPPDLPKPGHDPLLERCT